MFNWLLELSLKIILFWKLYVPRRAILLYIQTNEYYMNMGSEKIVIMIPTYNEAKNISGIIKEILDLRIKDLEIVVVDDNSPDHTFEIVRELNNPNVHLVLRKGKKGRGLAGKEGFLKALELGADYIIEMDADFSHDPKYIIEMLKEIKKCDVVLGSRLVKGGEDVKRSGIRKLVTLASNSYIGFLLGIPIKDCNSGYRCFRRRVLESVAPGLKEKGIFIVQEVLYKAYLKGFKIKEIPIRFMQRKEGESKFNTGYFLKGMGKIVKLKFLHITRKI